MLPTAHLAFLDEVFEGSSAILNSLLTLINERRFFNGSEVQSSDLITLLGSTNQVPDDPVLAAFSDRFLLRCRLDYVPDDVVEDMLDVGWTTEQRQIAASGNGQVVDVGSSQVRFGLADLAVLQRAVAAVDLAPVRDTYAAVVRELRDQGVAFSDRRAVKAQKVFAAAALLAGRRTAQLDDLAPLVHLWTDPRDEPALRRSLTEHGLTLADPGHRVRDPSEIRLDHVDLEARMRAAVAEDELREVVRQLGRLDMELRRDHSDEADLLGRVNATKRTAILAIDERFRRTSEEAR
jgi:MoxR-like ATPase